MESFVPRETIENVIVLGVFGHPNQNYFQEFYFNSIQR